MSVDIIQGDCREALARLPAASVHVCITSPPYFNLRSYNGGAAEIGTEATPSDYVAHLVGVFRGVHRVLRDDGLLFIVLGDSYANDTKWGGNGSGPATKNWTSGRGGYAGQKARRHTGFRPKDLMMIPHRVAIALQEDGWIVRSAITWCKDNPMPESVLDRPTSATEMVFMLAKKPAYYYDATAIAEPVVKGAAGSTFTLGKTGINGQGRVNQAARFEHATRNKRNWWRVNSEPLDEPHYAAFPEALITPMVLAGTSEAGACPRCLAPYRRVVERTPMVIARSGRRAAMGEQGRTQPSGTMVSPATSTTTGWQAGCTCEAGPPLGCTVLDIFCGSGTTGVVAKRYGRNFIGIELNESYCTLSEKRIAGVCEPLFTAATLGGSSAGAAR